MASFRVAKSDPSRHTVVCRSKDCTFKWHASKQANGEIKAVTVTPHICSPATHLGWRTANSVAIHLPRHQSFVEANRRLTPQSILTNERVVHGHNLQYRQAHRIREAARYQMEGNTADSYQKLPAYFDVLRTASSGTTAVLEVIEERFYRCFIAPAAVKNAAATLRPFVAMDGAHCTTPYGGILLIAVGLDANNESLPLAWAVVPVEDGNHWKWFLRQFQAAYPSLTAPRSVLMSDRDKGLIGGIQEVLPQCFAARCCQHLADNVATRYGAACRPLFWACAYAKTTEAFQEAVLALRQHHPMAATWLEAIDKQTWATCAFPTARYGHLTSNLVESINSHWLDARDHAAFGLLRAVWALMASKIYRRSEAKHADFICQKPAKLLDEAYTKSRRYAVTSYDQGIGTVTKGEGTYQVTLPASQCSCGSYQEIGIPCEHAIALCLAQRLDPEHYTMPIYHTTAYKQQYEQRLPPFDSENLALAASCKVSCHQRAAGRPRKARRRIGQNAGSSYTCQRCGEQGHNSRNKRCQGARNGGL